MAVKKHMQDRVLFNMHKHIKAGPRRIGSNTKKKKKNIAIGSFLD
jgi:hypothetical protein